MSTINIGDYCSFSVLNPGDEWISDIYIVNQTQGNEVLLDVGPYSAPNEGHRDNTDKIIECNPGDILNISVTVDAGSSFWNEALSWGHTIDSEDLVTVDDLHLSDGCPWTHTYTWEVPDNPGTYLVSWWVHYANYDDGCGSFSYGERQSYTLQINESEFTGEGGSTTTLTVDIEPHELDLLGWSAANYNVNDIPTDAWQGFDSQYDDFSIQEDSDGKYLEFSSQDWQTSHLRYIEEDQTYTNVEIEALMKVPGMESGSGLYVRGINEDPTGNTEQSLFSYLSEAFYAGSYVPTINIYEIYDDDIDIQDREPHFIDEDTLFRYKLLVIDNKVLSKVWPDGTPEPETWNAGSFIDALNEGYVGIVHLEGLPLKLYSFNVVPDPDPPDLIDINDYCSFSITGSSIFDWISWIRIENQDEEVLLQARSEDYPYASYPGGHRDNTNMVIECYPGDTLTISVTVDASSTAYRQYLSWGHTIISEDLITEDHLHDADNCPWTHTYDWEVPDEPGTYLVAWWENYNFYTTGCGMKQYAERHSYTLRILPPDYEHHEGGSTLSLTADTESDSFKSMSLPGQDIILEVSTESSTKKNALDSSTTNLEISTTSAQTKNTFAYSDIILTIDTEGQGIYVIREGSTTTLTANTQSLSSKNISEGSLSEIQVATEQESFKALEQHSEINITLDIEGLYFKSIAVAPRARLTITTEYEYFRKTFSSSEIILSLYPHIKYLKFISDSSETYIQVSTEVYGYAEGIHQGSSLTLTTEIEFEGFKRQDAFTEIPLQLYTEGLRYVPSYDGYSEVELETSTTKEGYKNAFGGSIARITFETLYIAPIEFKGKYFSNDEFRGKISETADEYKAKIFILGR